MQTAIRNALLVTGLLVIASFYYWMSWSPEVPVLGGDHAVYLLMADYLSPFSDRSYDVTRAALSYSYFPPLYPLMLGILGGTSAHVEVAHAITVTFLVVALVWYFLWARREIQSSYQAFLLTAIFAFLPATFLQSFGILSEYLYLLLTLIAVWLLTRPGISLSHLYGASIVIGLAAVTRTVGITLVVAFAVYLFIHKRDRWVRLVLVSLMPAVSWQVLKWALGYEGGYLWIVTSLMETRPLLDLIWEQLSTESHSLWIGWITSFDHIPSVMALIVGSVIGVICIAGTVYRVYLRKFDGFYLVLYLGVFTLWPSTFDTRRFLYVVLPILMLHGLYFARYQIHRLAPLKPCIFGYVYLFVIVLLVLPAAGFVFRQLVMAANVENQAYANSLYWYSGGDLNRTRMKINAYKKLTQSWQKIPDVVPAGECVYSVDPTWLMLYADRPSYSTPQAPAKDQFLKEAKNCRYIYVASYARPPYPLFYPRDYIMGQGQIVSVDRVEKMEGEPIVGMLVKMPKYDVLGK